ncbi:MAG: hypothetical protein Q7J74_00825 [Pseudomonas sp.]|nr:hypothetical protein [Pseudomonas sp.]
MTLAWMIQAAFTDRQIGAAKIAANSDRVTTTALGYAALKTDSKCSFTTRELHFFACFCLA